MNKSFIFNTPPQAGEYAPFIPRLEISPWKTTLLSPFVSTSANCLLVEIYGVQISPLTSPLWNVYPLQCALFYHVEQDYEQC